MYKTIAKIVKHISCVQEAMLHCVDELRKRLLVHDASKFEQDELIGVARFEQMPEGLEYGSPEYKAEMAKVMEGNNFFELHAARNDHHPEHYDVPEQGVDLGMMGVFPLMEMVCDWAGAHLTYGNTGGWTASVKTNIDKHNFSESQQWVIRDIAGFLMRKIPELQDTLDTTASESPSISLDAITETPDILNMPFSEVVKLASMSIKTDILAQDLITLLKHQSEQGNLIN